MAEERGIDLVEAKETASEDFTELVAVRLGSGTGEVEVAGTGVGPRNEPYLVSVWGESFYLPFAEHIAVFRYADRPGMIGRVGTAFGEEGVNIVSAAVGAEEDGERAVMALTTDAPVHDATVAKILEIDGFSVGRAVDLALRERRPGGEVRHARRQVGLPQPGGEAAQHRDQHQPRDAPDHARCCTAARLTGPTL